MRSYMRQQQKAGERVADVHGHDGTARYNQTRFCSCLRTGPISTKWSRRAVACPVRTKGPNLSCRGSSNY